MQIDPPDGCLFDARLVDSQNTSATSNTRSQTRDFHFFIVAAKKAAIRIEQLVKQNEVNASKVLSAVACCTLATDFPQRIKRK